MGGRQGTNTTELFPGSVVTLENVFTNLKKYVRRSNCHHINHITGLEVDRDGVWFIVKWSNGDQHCFNRLDEAIQFMDRNIPK